MIFVGGIHGVGKTRFCKEAANLTGVPSYSASLLISERKNVRFPKDKNIQGIDENQSFLMSAVKELKASSNQFLIDGHFCLLDESGHVVRINKSTFLAIAPEGILILTETPTVIVERRLARDGVKSNLSEIMEFQNEEISYAQELAMDMNIPIAILSGEDHLVEGCEFITRVMGGVR